MGKGRRAPAASGNQRKIAAQLRCCRRRGTARIFPQHQRTRVGAAFCVPVCGWKVCQGLPNVPIDIDPSSAMQSPGPQKQVLYPCIRPSYRGTRAITVRLGRSVRRGLIYPPRPRQPLTRGATRQCPPPSSRRSNCQRRTRHVQRSVAAPIGRVIVSLRRHVSWRRDSPPVLILCLLRPSRRRGEWGRPGI